MKVFISTQDVNGELKFALLVNGTEIIDPYLSECGRFDVDPVAYYGIDAATAQALTDLNNDSDTDTTDTTTGA